jgi:hypothetical protein
MLDKRPAPSPDGAAGAKNPLQQLADGDDADRAFLVAEQRLDVLRWLRSLEVDQDVGVD